MTETYLNPVYSASCPDPFVLKYCGEYWAYCTGRWDDGRCFGVLRSRDLVRWQPMGGGALEPLPGDVPHYWAPEVTYHNGTFYMYYSAGDELTSMRIRVATAKHPAGPFVDSGRALTNEPFAIDAHVFVADDGSWHLFYAADFLEHTHIGTGTLRDRLIDPFTLEGRPTPVTRPCYDWHVYDPNRAEKGGVRWHTVEGPFVLHRKGRFYQMFSGGNWQNLTYGVGYAVADAPGTPDEWAHVCDGERVLPILRTVPGQVIGPGHNSVVRGPDNVQPFCVYHRWAADSSARVLAIDRLDWAGERMLVLGPSNEPQPVPNPPTFAGFGGDDLADGPGAGWSCAGGGWSVAGGVAQVAPASRAEARFSTPITHGVIEVSLRLDDDPEQRGAFGVELLPGGDAGAVLSVMIVPSANQVVISGASGGKFDLPRDFDPRAFHLLRLEIDGLNVRLTLDGQALCWRIWLRAGSFNLGLVARFAAASFAGFAWTRGWEDLFADEGADPADLGWQTEHQSDWRVAGGALRCDTRDEAAITKGPLLEAYEFVVNARLEDGDTGGSYGFYPVAAEGDRGPLLAVERDGAGWALVCRGGEESRFALPGFDAAESQQFRFRKRGGRLAIQWEARDLGEIAVTTAATRVGLRVRQAATAFDMARVTALPM